MSTFFAIAWFALLAACLVMWRVGQHRRNTRSWESILARLRSDWSARALCDFCFSGRASTSAPIARLRRIQGAHGLWAMFRNAGVMLELADYAARNGDSVDQEMLAVLHRDATLIRLFVVKMAAEFAFRAAGESISMSLLQAESAFAEMELCTTEFLQANASEIVPQFVAAV